MLPDLLDPGAYPFWLLAASLLCLALERLIPWRPEQRLLRPQLGQDCLWLLINGHLGPICIGAATIALLGWARPAWDTLEGVRLLAPLPLAGQLGVALVLKDLLGWLVHNLLHRVPCLWELHKVHHSIEQLDWIGNFRFHWAESVIYRAMGYAPLAILGVDTAAMLHVYAFETLIGHLNHSNLNLSWGPLRYVLNSPRMHVWHHARSWPDGHPKGVNFAIVFSTWDWLFRTAHWPDRELNPRQQPEALGFEGMERLPRGLARRLIHPLASSAPPAES